MYRNILTFLLCIVANMCLNYLTILKIPKVSASLLPSNNVEDLLLEHYFQKLIDSWQSEKVVVRLEEYQKSKMQGDLKGLYKTLKHHPALMDRRLQVGGRLPPPLPLLTNENHHLIKKRSVFDIGIAQPVCPFKMEWLLLLRAKDMNNTDVEIFQPTDNSHRYQWFYTVTCDFDALLEENTECPYCCMGINSRRFASQCIPRKSYVMALVRRRPELGFDWDYIQVDTSCNCAVSPAIG